MRQYTWATFKSAFYDIANRSARLEDWTEHVRCRDMGMDHSDHETTSGAVFKMPVNMDAPRVLRYEAMRMHFESDCTPCRGSGKLSCHGCTGRTIEDYQDEEEFAIV